MIAVFDTETTGLDPATASILELGVVTLPGFDSFSCLIKPSHEIEIQAMAAHHLTDEMVKTGAPLKEAIEASRMLEADYLCAHNAAFDMGFMKPLVGDKLVICTYRCARHLWQDMLGYSNQVLRYSLIALNDKLCTHHGGDKIMQLPPHRALPDAWVTAHILERMLEEKTPDDLVALTKAPILMKMCGFGKHKGLEWSKVPKDYLAWIIRQKDFDADSIHTAKHHLGMI